MAEPRSERAPFTKVEFLVTPDYEIRHLIVAAEGASTMEFRFEREKLNPALAEKLFQFQAPAGAGAEDCRDAETPSDTSRLCGEMMR